MAVAVVVVPVAVVGTAAAAAAADGASLAEWGSWVGRRAGARNWDAAVAVRAAATSAGSRRERRPVDAASNACSRWPTRSGGGNGRGRARWLVPCLPGAEGGECADWCGSWRRPPRAAPPFPLEPPKRQFQCWTGSRAVGCRALLTIWLTNPDTLRQTSHPVPRLDVTRERYSPAPLSMLVGSQSSHRHCPAPCAIS